MEPLISVIVPIYSIERYLGICVESLLKQTYKNLEIILVDDGSPDRCPEICDLYQKKDSRVRVIHKPNGGLVSARKAGVAAARGRYVGYVDGDDWVEPGFYESMITAMTESGAELVVAGHRKDLFSTSSCIRSTVPAGCYRGESLERLKCNMLSCGRFHRVGVTTYVWNKLFIREKLIEVQNAVDNGISIGEDAAVVYPYIMKCDAVRVIDRCEYHYRQREDSMLKKSASFQKEAEGLHKLYTHLSGFAENQPERYGLKKQAEDFILGICIMRSGGVLKEFREEFIPYSDKFFGKDIVIWSAGTFGQQLLNRIRESNYCNVVGWIDDDYWECRRCCLDVDPVDDIDFLKFDYLLLATVDGTGAEEMKAKFVWRGVPEEKILTIDCPEEKRSYYLHRYLGIQ